MRLLIYITKWLSRKIVSVCIPTSSMGRSDVRIMIAVVDKDPELGIASNI